MQVACATGLSPLGCRSRSICTSAVAPPLSQRTHINTASFSGRTDAEANQWREPRGCGLLRQQQRSIACGALDPSHLSNHLDSLHAAAQTVQHGGLHSFALDQLAYIVDHMPLAYERVTLPCSSMNCGDVIYRSTLDPALRMERKLFPDPRGLLLLGLGLLYLLAKPGVLAGAWDYYVGAKIQRAKAKAFGQEDIKLGKKLAQGGFGTVFKAELIEDDEITPIVVKKAVEFGVPEVWMNERLMRCAPNNFAEFLTAFEEPDPKKGDMLWLVWRYEGDFTLFDLLQKRDWPYNAEALMRGKGKGPPSQNRSPRRKMSIIRGIMKSILQGLKACHNTGIVHRDVKPQNVMVSEVDRCIKFIDLGAAADLRIGTNYIPNEFLLDPRYAPPQQYIMSTQTPQAPPRPVAALLSPILWRLNTPDRFDMYSTGITFLQLVFRPLQSDNGLCAFNKKLEKAGFDLNKWRREQEGKGGKDWAEGFQCMDLYDGAGWDLACGLVQYAPEKRLSAQEALGHPAITASPLTKALVRAKQVTSSAEAAAAAIAQPWTSSTQRDGGLTEAQIAELGEEMGTVPESLRRASSTVSWWQVVGRPTFLQVLTCTAV